MRAFYQFSGSLDRPKASFRWLNRLILNDFQPCVDARKVPHFTLHAFSDVTVAIPPQSCEGQIMCKSLQPLYHSRDWSTCALLIQV